MRKCSEAAPVCKHIWSGGAWCLLGAQAGVCECVWQVHTPSHRHQWRLLQCCNLMLFFKVHKIDQKTFAGKSKNTFSIFPWDVRNKGNVSTGDQTVNCRNRLIISLILGLNTSYRSQYVLCKRQMKWYKLYIFINDGLQPFSGSFAKPYFFFPMLETKTFLWSCSSCSGPQPLQQRGGALTAVVMITNKLEESLWFERVLHLGHFHCFTCCHTAPPPTRIVADVHNTEQWIMSSSETSVCLLNN